MTGVFFHTDEEYGAAHVPALETNYHVDGAHVGVTLKIGFNDLTVFARLPEAMQIAATFREAADALCDKLAQPREEEAVSA
jgi:hypothetical protein